MLEATLHSHNIAKYGDLEVRHNAPIGELCRKLVDRGLGDHLIRFTRNGTQVFKNPARVSTYAAYTVVEGPFYPKRVTVS